jgi:Rrf2 family protein
MRIPTKARYGLRAMLDLAMHEAHRRPILLKDVAARQGISESYLGQIFILLRHAGLVRGARGAGGGFMLARPPQEISLLEVVEACIGDMKMVDCVGKRESCRRADSCAARSVWTEVDRAMRQVLEGKNLSGLAEAQKVMEADLATMYYI